MGIIPGMVYRTKLFVVQFSDKWYTSYNIWPKNIVPFFYIYSYFVPMCVMFLYVCNVYMRNQRKAKGGEGGSHDS